MLNFCSSFSKQYYGCDIVYGDSVTGDEPLILRNSEGLIEIKTIESLSEEYWNGVPSPNSSALILTPSIGYLFSTKKGAIGINVQRPIFVEGSFSAYAGDMDQGTSVWQIVLSFRSMAAKLN